MRKRWLRLIWFIEKGWTKKHATIGIKGERTLCGILRSTRSILHKEMNRQDKDDCKNCLGVVNKRYGGPSAYIVPVD